MAKEYRSFPEWIQDLLAQVPQLRVRNIKNSAF